MPNGMLNPDEFEGIEDHTRKINILYRLIYELYRRRRWDSVKDGAKTVFGGFLGAIAFMAGKDIFGR